jgi:hypothetical protein
LARFINLKITALADGLPHAQESKNQVLDCLYPFDQVLIFSRTFGKA